MKKALAAVSLWAFAASPALAQGCAMCRSSIAAQNESVIASINAGILVLLLPPLAIMSTIIYFALREER